jgi:hypothetical protein
MDNLTPSQRYYQTHKEQKKKYGREYYHQNREKILKSIRERQEPGAIAPVCASPLDSHRTRGVRANTEGVTLSFN